MPLVMKRGVWNPGPQYLDPGPHNQPLRRPGSPGYPGMPGAGVTSVREVNRYPLTVTINFTLGAASILAVPEADTTRIMLCFRAPSTNAAGDNVLVAFGQNANVNTAWFEIVPGGVVFLDYGIPQDDVYMAALAGAPVVVVGYANSNL